MSDESLSEPIERRVATKIMNGSSETGRVSTKMNHYREAPAQNL